MSMPKDYPVVQVERLRVLTVRRSLADQTEVARALAELLPSVADVIDGPPMALRTGFPQDGIAPFDLAFPVRDPVEREGFVTKALPELPVFSIIHEGVLKDGPEGTNLADTWQGFIEFLGDKGLLLGDDPTRFVYHEGVETVGTENEHVRLEVQLSYHWPMWLEAFSTGGTTHLDVGAADRVLAGSDDL